MQQGVIKFKKKQGESNGAAKRIQQQDMISQEDVSDNSVKQQFNIHKIDFYAFLASGCSFLLFNICYWAIFLAFNENFFDEN